MDRLQVTEGDSLSLDATTAQLLRERLEALRAELRPRMPFLAGDGSKPIVHNLVGSVQLSPTLVLDVVPKTRPHQDWVISVFDLLSQERVTFEALTDKAEKSGRLTLPDAFARLYADQLEAAVRREGPLMVLVGVDTERSMLAGRLDVTAWSRTNLVRPHVFPQRQTSLTADNPYTAALAWVAEALAVRCSSPVVASRLRASAARIRPGLAAHTTVDPGVATRELPPQWQAYRPAWVTACAVLRRISPLHRSGLLAGLSLAVEPWLLLETLLHRSLNAAARLSGTVGVPLTSHGHSTNILLEPKATGSPRPPLERIHGNRSVDPDGSLRSHKQVVATFEAKYSYPKRPESIRSHVFQAMTTAAALGSPLAVLVYPERSDPVAWDVSGFDNKPRHVVAVGLDMYGYRRGIGEFQRGQLLLDTVRSFSEIRQTQPVAPTYAM